MPSCESLLGHSISFLLSAVCIAVQAAFGYGGSSLQLARGRLQMLRRRCWGLQQQLTIALEQEAGALWRDNVLLKCKLAQTPDCQQVHLLRPCMLCIVSVLS